MSRAPVKQSGEEENSVTPQMLSKLDGLPEDVKEHARTNLFVEPWTFTEAASKSLKSWIESQPLNSEKAESAKKQFSALAPYPGQTLLLARVNFEENAYQFYIHPTEQRLLHWSQSDYPNIERFIKDSHRITGIFGYWPSFHDAEVHNLTLNRGGFDVDKQIFAPASMTVEIEFWERTREVDAKGFFVSTKRMRAMLKFQNIEEVQIEGFNTQNAILYLYIKRVIQEDRTFFNIEFNPAHGLVSIFCCSEVEVLSVTPVLKMEKA